MRLDFAIVVTNLVSLFAIIATGYVAVKAGAISQKASGFFSALLMKITLPCTIFLSLAQKEYNPAFIHDSVIIIVAGLILFPGMMYISRYLAPAFRVDKSYRGVWAFICAYSNSGFMGFPIALALFGAEGLALSVMLNTAFNITIYSLGAMEIIRDNPNHDAERLNVRAIVFSPLNIALVLSLIFYFGKIGVPEIVERPMVYLSAITTPLSMIIIGMALARESGLELFTNKDAWTATLMRLIVFPVVLCGLLKVIPISDNPMISAVLVLIMAMPGASVTAVLCDMYHGNIDFAAKAMFLQNLLCIATIPVICLMIA